MVHAIQENATEGAQQVQQTGVGGDAKIVYALLTGMVSDKVVYPVREYATNAWEVSPAGKPFEVELPTAFNPQFTIRDFGPGLKHTFMMKSYAKIGESTKDNDDDAVGGWGFGSKAALAYLMRSDGAGSFTVISRHRGFRRVYIIGVSEMGKIQIQFMGEWVLEPEDRGTGLEITFPVREADIQRFRDHAEAVYWSFEPKPVISPAIDFGKPEILHQGNGWKVYRGGSKGQYGNYPSSVPFTGPQVQLGPVMYPIDPDLMPATDMLDAETCIVFEAKIGTISVSASRENLQYDDRTEAGLKALFEHYREDWMAAAQAAIDAEPNYFRARWKAADISRTLPGSGWGIVRGLGWRGFEFHDKLFPNGWRAKAAKWPEVRGRNVHASQPVAFRHDFEINPGELQGRKVVIQHASNRSLERIEAAGLLDTPFLWVRCKRADKDWALEQMGNPEYIVLDDIKLPKVATGPRQKRPESVKRRKLMSFGLDTWTDYVDQDEELLYVRIAGRGRKLTHTLMIDGELREFNARYGSNLKSIIVVLQAQGLLDDDAKITVLGEGEAPLDHWISLGDHLVEVIDAALDPTQVKPVIPWAYTSFPSALRTLNDKKVDIGLAPPELREMINEMRQLARQRTTLDREDNDHDRLAAQMLALTGNDLKTTAKDPTQPVRQAWKKFHEQYPLVEFLAEKHLNGYYATMSDSIQRSFDHYFKLITK
ncbi:MAG: hypothetical protein DI590_05580 [Methylorubrum populi]|nr:MAG: hypothetical protein DI590_05580 [Methylorubrum populi]